MSIVALPFIIRTDYVISLWLTEVPLYTSEFLKLALILSIIISFTEPISNAIYATGNIKKYQIAEFIALISILPITYIVLKYNTVPYNIYYVRICIFIIFLLIRLLFLQKQLNFSFKLSIVIIFQISCCVTISTLTLLVIASSLPYNLGGFILLCIFSLITNICYAYILAFNSKEKKQIKIFIQQTLHK